MSKIEQSINFILDKSTSQGKKKYYSLSEINLSETKYDQLKQDVESHLTLAEFNYWSRYWITYKNHPRSALLGYLLLLLISETVRRQGSEGRPWSAARKIQFQDAVDKKFFQYKQPSEQLKDLIKQAATHFNLRHVFDIEGKQEWASSIFLQLGFTYNGSKKQLATWFSAEEQRPLAVQLLLEGKMASESFQELWETLTRYRKGNIPHSKAVTDLKQSPWILNDWIDDILEAAAQKIKNTSSHTDFQDNETTHILNQLLSKPKLIWDTQPYFVISFENLSIVDLTGDEYTLIVNTSEQVRFFKEDDYYIPNQPEILIKPAQFQPELSFTLFIGNKDQKSKDKEEIDVKDIVETYAISLWNIEDEITIFDANTGFVINKKQLDNQKEYILLVSVDLEITPQPSVFHCLPTHKKKLYRLIPVWKQISIPAIGWQSQCIYDKQEESLNINQIFIHLKEEPSRIFNLGELVQFRLDIKKPDIDIVAVRVAGNPVEFTDNIITVELDPKSLISNQNIQLYEVRFKIICCNHEYQYFTVKKSSIPLKVQGVAKQTDTGWHILDSNQILTCQQAKTMQVKFFTIFEDEQLIPIQDYKNYGLIEGRHWITRVWQRPRLIGKLSGLGQPLTVRYGPYNGQSETLFLAQSVVDNGIIQKVEINDELIEITLHDPREFTQTVDKIIIWYSDEIIVLDDVDCEENQWFLLEEYGGKLLALGIFYEGVCLGRYWQQGWLGLLAQSQLDSSLLASLLIWFKLPILQQEATEVIKPKILANPVSFLEHWILTDFYRLETSNIALSWSDKKEMGITLTKHFFADWQPEPQHVNSIVEKMIDLYEIEDNPLDIQNLLFQIFEFHPVLAVRFFKAYVDLNQFGKLQIQQLISIFKAEKRTNYQETLKYFSEQMQLDETFIEKILNPVFDTFQNEEITPKPVGYDTNLSLLLNLSSFQELLLLSLLTKIEKDYE